MKPLLTAGIGLTALLLGCQSKKDDTPQPPTASFTYTGTAQNFTAIDFTSVAPNAATYAWDFGDASTSTEPNPSHVFRRAGTYTVVLNATGANGTASSRQTLTLAQADTNAIIIQRRAGNYRFNRVYRVFAYPNTPTTRVRLHDTTMTVAPDYSRIDMYNISWFKRGNGTWNRAGMPPRPTYVFTQGGGSQNTDAVFLQNSDRVYFSITEFGGIRYGATQYLTFYGGKIR